MEPDIFFAIIAFVWGACAGSFANVCIYRMPRDASIVAPRSHCPACGRLIPWYLNIPLLSFLLLRAKCKFCGARIKARYFMVELLTAILFLSIWLKYGLDARTAVYWIMALGLIIGTFIDFEHMIIPDRITIGGMVLGPLLSLLVPELHGCSSHYMGFRAALLGLTTGAFSLLAVALLGSFVFKKEAMGMGDVKLLGGIGAFLGWQSILFVIMASSMAGAAVGISLILSGRKQLSSRIPYGPYIALAAILWILGGGDLWQTYIMYFE